MASSRPDKAKILGFKSKIEKSVTNDDPENVLLLLSEIHNLPIDKVSLKETKIGATLAKLRKHPNAEVVKAATEIVNSWKERLRKQEKSGVSKVAPESSGRGNSKSKSKPTAPKPIASGLSGSTGSLSSSTSSLSGSGSSDIREKIRNILKDILLSGKSSAMAPRLKSIIEESKDASNASTDDSKKSVSEVTEESRIAGLAEDIEAALYKKHGNEANNAYKTQFRSLRFNLKANADLLGTVLIGYYSAEDLCNLSSEDMANESKKKEIKEARDYYNEFVQAGQVDVATTDNFKCHKCGQRKCTYFQMQTRSADEPMTTFVTCQNCGKRWKC